MIGCFLSQERFGHQCLLAFELIPQTFIDGHQLLNLCCRAENGEPMRLFALRTRERLSHVIWRACMHEKEVVCGSFEWLRKMNMEERSHDAVSCLGKVMIARPSNQILV